MIILKSENNMINFYYVSQYNNGINYKEKSLFDGYFTIKNCENKEYIRDVKVNDNSTKTSFTSVEFNNLLKKHEVLVIGEDYPLRQYLKQENINYNMELFCQKCAENDTIKVLNEKNTYHYNKLGICKECAGGYLKKAMINNGYLDYLDRNNDFLMEKYHDINEIIRIMDDGFDPVDNDKLTLYDILPVTEEEYEKVSVNDLNIPKKFKEILMERIQNLMPVQILSLKEGLLENEDLLVVSQTGSGKTLIGELSGISKAMKDEKMIYLSPLVALANQKYNDFKKHYEKLGLSIAIKVGQNRIKSEDELYIPDEDINDADIIVATYEGLDFILRSGNYKNLEKVGTVIIDEIQMLENEERGHRLNALINRISTLFNHAQLIGLSATIKNANSLAKNFSMTLVEYDKRPVKLERHFLNVKNKQEKRRYMTELCKKEFSRISSKGYHGQTIIFTDSRRKTQLISSTLNKKGVNAEYYHAGLTYSKKLEIEEAFINQDISTVVTTAALSSGVDFPASMVLFDSVHMGREYITNNEFHQMLGRAGRPSFHDMGKAYVLVSNYSDDYDVALDLLKGDVNNINVLYDEMDVYEDVLSDICALEEVDLKRLKKFYDNQWIPVTFDEAIGLLADKKMIYYDSTNYCYYPTDYGKAISKSFINIKEAETIKNNLYNDVIDMVLEIDVIHNAYFSNVVLRKLSSILNMNVGSNVFSENNRKIILDGTYINRLGERFENKLMNINKDFMGCDCSSPYCYCFEKNVSEHIINRRLQGWDPKEISKEFKRDYEMLIYSGDVYSYLNQVVMMLEAIKRISYSLKINSTAKTCENLISKIEEGRKF